MVSGGALKFVADANVGRLARWLRAMGYDTLFDKDIDDRGLVRIALTEGRVLLTRDRKLMQRRVVASGQVRAILIKDDDAPLQLQQVAEALGLDQVERMFSLCLECNEALEAVPKGQIRNQVPPYVFETQAVFARCPSCRRVYWQGTHWERMRAELGRLSGAGMAE